MSGFIFGRLKNRITEFGGDAVEAQTPPQDTINGVLLDSRTGVQYPKRTVTRDWGLVAEVLTRRGPEARRILLSL